MVRRLMKTHKAYIILITLAVISIAVTVVYFCYKVKDDHITLAQDSEKIDETPMVVSRIKEIGQWEFLAVSDEELIDTVRRGFFGDDELVRIYYGTLRIGIDFSHCNEQWVTLKDDSVSIDLPPVSLLDENFLDEARTRSFFESGKWTNADRKAMAERAKQAMRRRCLTKANLDKAQKTAEQQIRLFLNTVKKKGGKK